MDVRSIEDVAPIIEHNGTVPVWWLVEPREMFRSIPPSVSNKRPVPLDAFIEDRCERCRNKVSPHGLHPG